MDHISESYDMSKCKVCSTKVKYILVHLKNKKGCQKEYNMKLLNDQILELKRKKWRLKGQKYRKDSSVKEKEKVRRQQNYEKNKTKEKEKRMIRYYANKEKEEKKMKRRYILNKDIGK